MNLFPVILHEYFYGNTFNNITFTFVYLLRKCDVLKYVLLYQNKLHINTNLLEIIASFIAITCDKL